MMILYSVLYRFLGIIRFFCKLAIWIFGAQVFLMFGAGLASETTLAHISAYARPVVNLLLAVVVLHFTKRIARI